MCLDEAMYINNYVYASACVFVCVYVYCNVCIEVWWRLLPMNMSLNAFKPERTVYNMLQIMI